MKVKRIRVLCITDIIRRPYSSLLIYEKNKWYFAEKMVLNSYWVNSYWVYTEDVYSGTGARFYNQKVRQFIFNGITVYIFSDYFYTEQELRKKKLKELSLI